MLPLNTTRTMKTFYRSFFIILALILSSATYIQSQLCVHDTATLNPDGTYILDPDQILNIDLEPDQSAFVIPNYFTCDNLHDRTPVTLYLIDNGDTIDLCTKYVFIHDSTPPVAMCKSNLHVQLDEDGEYNFKFNDVDDHSFDLCTRIVSNKFFPDRISCTDPNPMEVMMVVRDLAGNQDTCMVLVSYDDYNGPTDPIECRDSLMYGIYLYDDGPKYITPDQVLVRGVHGCVDNYSIDIYEEATLRPGDYISIGDSLAMLIAVLTELESAEQCTTTITVKAFDDPCGIPTNPMCDTKCHSAPFGDCASGHTDEDPVELPCDIFITDWCALYEIDPQPEFIEWYGYPESENAWPSSGAGFITNEGNVGNIFVAYWDLEIALPTGQQIKRTWTLLNWCTEQTIEYVQNIFISYDLTDICDTLPWNSPVGDCQSGHTLSDDVEWPADITIHSLFSHPDDLALNAEVQFENIRPRVNHDDCVVNEIAYHDLVTEINDTTLRVERTWEVIDVYSQEHWQYVQIITIIHESLGSTVCVTTEDGKPIPGVELIAGVITDDSGCHEFPDPEGIIVTPVKDSPFECGVNILDLIILNEGLLGIHPLSGYQQYAADLNNSQGVTAIDIVVFRKFLLGDFTPVWSHAWRFFEQTTHLGSVDISDPFTPYKFIGVKMGDLDNSCLMNFTLEDIILRTEDEVLNAGETYSIPFYLERNENLDGFALRLKNENNNLEFLSVTAPNIPGFDPVSNVLNSLNTLTIQWVSPWQFLLNGVAVDSTEPLFILNIRASENIILNEHLSLETTFDNLLKPSDDDPLRIRLAWEDIVISSIVEIGNGRKIEFYPNPVTEILHLKGFTSEEAGKVFIIDPLGRIAFEGKIQTTLDISHLGVGMYYVVFEVGGVRSVAVHMVKI